MVARVIVQIAPDGERHVAITRDMHVPTEDLILTAPGWENARVIEGRVLVLDIDSLEVASEMLDLELCTHGFAPALLEGQ